MIDGITPLHLILVLAIALIVIGPGKLPEVGSALGKTIREFRKATSDVQDAVKFDGAPRQQAQAPMAQPMIQAMAAPMAAAPMAPIAPAPMAPVAQALQPAPAVMSPVAPIEPVVSAAAAPATSDDAGATPGI